MSFFIFAAACDEPDTNTNAPITNSVDDEGLGYEVIEFDDGGSIAGRVWWDGPQPNLEPLVVRTNHDHCGDEQPTRALRVSARGGVRDVVVSLVDVNRGRAATTRRTPGLEQVGCRFSPHVQVIQPGRLRLINADPILHNVHAFSEDSETLLDVGLPRAGDVVVRRLPDPGVVRVVCDAGHTFQQAWIHVIPGPYAVVTDEAGVFRLRDVPPGQYVLQIWHEGWRVVGTERGRPVYSNPVVLTRSISVSRRQETTIDFPLSQQSAEIAGQ